MKNSFRLGIFNSSTRGFIQAIANFGSGSQGFNEIKISTAVLPTIRLPDPTISL